MFRFKSSRYLIGLLLLSITLGSYGSSCNSTGNHQLDSTIRTIARTEDDISQGLDSATNILATAKQSGALKQEDIDVLKPILKTIGESNLQAIKLTKTSLTITGDLPVDKQKQLLDIINFASDQITSLNNEGVLRIKDPIKRQLFNTVVITLQNSVTSLIPLLVKKG